MPAVLVPHKGIPDLAAKVTPAMLSLLRRMQRAGIALNGNQLDPANAEVLRQLADLGLVDRPDVGLHASPPARRDAILGGGSGFRSLLEGLDF